MASSVINTGYELQNQINAITSDMLTISAQSLTSAQKDQVCANLGISRATLRDVPFAVAVNDWSGSGSSFTANFVSAYITSTAKWIMTYDSNIASYAKAHLNVATKSGGGGLTFSTSKKPTGTITGTVLVWDNDDGKLPTLIENTVTPIANGGTGQSTLSGAKSALGIQALSDNLASKLNFKLVGYQQVGQTKSYNIPDNVRALLIFISPSSCAFLMVAATSTGNTVATPVYKAADLTITTSTNTVTVAGVSGTTTMTVVSIPLNDAQPITQNT